MRMLFWIGTVLIAAWAVALVLLGFPDGLIHAVPAVGLVLIYADWVTQRGDPLDRNNHLPPVRSDRASLDTGERFTRDVPVTRG